LTGYATAEEEGGEEEKEEKRRDNRSGLKQASKQQ